MPIVQRMAILATKPIMRRITPRIIKGGSWHFAAAVWSWRGSRDQRRLAFTPNLTPATGSRKPPETAKPITQTDHEPARWLACVSQPRRFDMAFGAADDGADVAGS